jgi:hypothetical protein
VTATPTPAKLPVRPKWLPMEVQIEAERILDSGHADEALVLRLATDKRMKFVWRELEKCKQVSGCLSDWIALMNDRVDVQLPQDADALALFFWCAYTIAWLGAEVGTVSVHDLPIAQYQAVAAGLRYSAAKLRELRLRHGVQAEDHRWRWSSGDGPWDMHIREIEEAAKFCDENVEAFTELKAAEAPLVVDRIYGNRQARGYVRMLAIETRGFFGQLLAGTLATVASVALMRDVTITQVRNWCGTPANKNA